MKLIVKHHHPYNKLPQGEGCTEGYSSEILVPHLTQQNYNFTKNNNLFSSKFSLNSLKYID